jgi:DedD protein
VPVAPKKEVSQPVTPAEDLPEPPLPAAASEPVVEAVPAPKADTPAATVTDAKPEPRPEIRPVAPSTAANAKAPPNVPLSVTLAPARASRATPETTAGPTIAPEATVEPRVKPSVRVAETPTSQPILPSTVSRLFSGFVLRAGVFTNPQLAEQLHAKLTLSGVPSSVESRVQVGPFKTRQEAEAAQAKLKELGIETILLPPKGGRP